MKRCLIAVLLLTFAVPAAAQATPRTGKWNTRPESSTTMSISTTEVNPTHPTGLWARIYVRKGARCTDSTKPGQETVRFLREELYGVTIKRTGRRFYINYTHPTYHAKDRSWTTTSVKGSFSSRDSILKLRAHLDSEVGTQKCSVDYNVTLRRPRRPSS